VITPLDWFEDRRSKSGFEPRIASAESEEIGASPQVPPAARVFVELVRFFRTNWLKLLGVSVLVLIPCFWHREIISSDLGSHLYNAWLVHLIEHGQAPGLWIAHQRTNVLFDLLLSGLGSVFGLPDAEKIAVSLAVLIFFWGAFALVSAAARRPPWLLVPCIAMISYGWTFHLGFFNYYLSLGLSFFALAVFWRGKGWERLVAVALAPLITVANPLGLFWLLGASVYVGLAETKAGRRYQWILFTCGFAALFAIRHYIWLHYVADAGAKPFYDFNGADQLVLFGGRYRLVAGALLAFAAISLLVDILRRRREPGLWMSYRLPLQLYILLGAAVYMFPDAIHLPPPEATIALLTARLTSVSAVVGCCLFGVMRPSKWHLIASAAIAMVFFSYVYQDTAAVNKMEAQIVQLVSKLPPNQRVMATIKRPPGSRVLIQHIVDRACIGRCFSYGNYEPSSTAFRVRALPGNPYVMTGDTSDMEDGDYTVQPEDLPAYQVYQCSVSGTEICIRPLQAGEENDRLGIHPDE
jgi:hypothetical protein